MRNFSYQKHQIIAVTCHSGRRYADRPTSFLLYNERYEVAKVEREWLEPGEKHFIVQATKTEMPHDEKRFQICYDTKEDTWQLKELQ